MDPRRLTALPLLLLTMLLVAPRSLRASQDTCSLGEKAWNPSAPLRFGLSLSLRKEDHVNPLGCGMVSQAPLQIYVAAQWVCEKLNADLGNGSYVPGVQFGFDLLDDCRSPTRAVRYALDYVDLYSDCSPDNSTAELKLGIVGPSRSSTAEETADSLRRMPWPIVSFSATLATLTEGGADHPNFFRTVPSDKKQIQAILALLKKLRWTFVAVVYTDDNYGTMSSQMLKEEAAQNDVCIHLSIAIGLTTDISDVVSQLVSKRQEAQGESMAVVYIGERDKAENLIFNLRSLNAFGLHFIMSDSVGIDSDVFDSGRLPTGSNIALGSFTLAPSSIVLKEFEGYLNKQYADAKAGLVQDDVIKSYIDTVQGDLEPVRHNTFVPLAVTAIFAMAEAARLSHVQHCANTDGLCQEMLSSVRTGEILTRMRNMKLDFGSMDELVAPMELRDGQYVLEFDQQGDVVPKPAMDDYTVFAFDDDKTDKFHKVGVFSGGELTLDTTSVRMLTKTGEETSEIQTSVCSGSCSKCADNGQIPLAFINGSAYIIGVFSLHERNAEQPFQCGDFRNVSNDAVVLEAFLHQVQRLRAQTGIDFGAVAFDDCYAPLHITSVLSDFLSGLVPSDKGLFEVCVKQEDVVGVVGALSSDATLAVASFCTPQRIPTISYAASSPDLDDPTNYPYFLRTVPSDEEQAIAMTELVKKMGWEYVGLLHVDNNYGTKGALAFERVAVQRGVCVAEPVAISVNPSNDEKHLYDAFVTLVQQNVKVVIFFGIDTRMADFLQLIESRNEQGQIVFVASEDWGTKVDVLAAGFKAARGSLTFKVDNTYIDPATEQSLRTRLLDKRPSPDDVNPWFAEFWQHVFDCNIPGGFNNIFTRECDPNEKLSPSQVDAMLNDQRVMHVINAAQAMATGLAAASSLICEDVFPCPFLRNYRYAQEVYESIKSQAVSYGSSKEQLFDQNGNGNIGFTIYNIQRKEQEYVYKEVGQYSKRGGLTLNTEAIHFYTPTGLVQDNVDASCTETRCVGECIKQPEVLPTAAPVSTSGDDFEVANLVIVIVLLVVCLLLVCFLFAGFNYFRQKVRRLCKELQEKSDPVYHVVNTPTHATYNNVEHHNLNTLPSVASQRIDFVNGQQSGHTSPGNTLDGRTNPAFLSNSTLNGFGVATVSDHNMFPAHRASSPHLPALPLRHDPRPPVPAPPFHHSVSVGPRLQHDVNDDLTSSASPHHYYMTHSLASTRELPAIPTDPSVAPSSSASPLRSQHRHQQAALPSSSAAAAHVLQTQPSQGYGRIQGQGQVVAPEQIAMHLLSQRVGYCHHPDDLDRAPPPRQTLPSNATSSSASTSSPPSSSQLHQQSEGSSLDTHTESSATPYFRMAPSGQLQRDEEAVREEEEEGEEDEEEGSFGLNTYRLAPPVETREGGGDETSSPTHAAHPTIYSTTAWQVNPDGAGQRHRSESLTSSTTYSGIGGVGLGVGGRATPRERCESFPPAYSSNSNPPGVIPPMVITPELQRALLRQLLADSAASLESLPTHQGQGQYYPGQGQHHGQGQYYDQYQGRGYDQGQGQQQQRSPEHYYPSYPAGDFSPDSDADNRFPPAHPPLLKHQSRSVPGTPDRSLTRRDRHQRQQPHHHHRPPSRQLEDSRLVLASDGGGGGGGLNEDLWPHQQRPQNQQLQRMASPGFGQSGGHGDVAAAQSLQSGVYAARPDLDQRWSPGLSLANMPNTSLASPPVAESPVGGGPRDSPAGRGTDSDQGSSSTPDSGPGDLHHGVRWTLQSLESLDDPANQQQSPHHHHQQQQQQPQNPSQQLQRKLLLQQQQEQQLQQLQQQQLYHQQQLEQQQLYQQQQLQQQTLLLQHQQLKQQQQQQQPPAQQQLQQGPQHDLSHQSDEDQAPELPQQGEESGPQTSPILRRGSDAKVLAPSDISSLNVSNV